MFDNVEEYSENSPTYAFWTEKVDDCNALFWAQKLVWNDQMVAHQWPQNNIDVSTSCLNFKLR